MGGGGRVFCAERREQNDVFFVKLVLLCPKDNRYSTLLCQHGPLWLELPTSHMCSTNYHTFCNCTVIVQISAV